MIRNDKQNDGIYIIRSNHFVQEYLEKIEIDPKIKQNPRFQSIIWYISVMLKKANIDFTSQKAIEWINKSIKTEKGDIKYLLYRENRYYSFDSNEAIQFVRYFYDEEGLKRQVREVDKRGQNSLNMLSVFNDDGIEVKQIVEDLERGCTCVFERVKNRPELRSVIEYDKNQEIVRTSYEKRILWTALEDFNPNYIEVDPIEINPMFKLGNLRFYEEFSQIDNYQKQVTGNQILALPQIRREEMLKHYKSLNRKFHRTQIFENGMAKMLSIKNKEYEV